ncbi:MAG: 50S ribosomal protein L5 [Candidatus Micrarchaeota archaeon]
MNKVSIDKVTLNIGVGEGGQALENARNLLEKITSTKAVTTKARNRIPTFKLRRGDPIGVKTTLRGKIAKEVVQKGLKVIENKMNSRSFDDYGTCGFGVKEYIDYPGIKYDPNIGMIGFDVIITLKKPGIRVLRRRIASRKIPKKQRVSKKEAQEFMKQEFGVELV